MTGERRCASYVSLPTDKDGVHMTLPIESVFDLSPVEKLQLVEDLWDDLAATPEAIPVHDWQKEELARRKANLQNSPAPAGLSWEEVRQRMRAQPSQTSRGSHRENESA